jgi:hypothetical protein
VTAGELRDGLRYLGKEKGAAILFALETQMTGHAVGRLTWSDAMRMFREGRLSKLAMACTRACPRQLYLHYVFWATDPELSLPSPLFSLESDVFDAFGFLWNELAQAYGRIIMIDGTAEAKGLLELLVGGSRPAGQPGVDG